MAGLRFNIHGVLVIITVAITANVPLSAQSCSCGGAPLLGSLGSSITAVGAWQIDSQYDYNDLSGLASGTSSLDRDGRRQISQSSLLRISYGLGPWLSATTIITAVAKERTVSDQVKTFGIGDGIALLQANLMPKLTYPQRDLIIGVGLKAPLGRTDFGRDGVRYSPDLQPTSGAWDLLASIYATSDIFLPRPATLIVSGSYRRTTENPELDTGRDHYRFGNETVLNIGLTYGLGLNAQTSLRLNYRETEPDTRDGQVQPNSGGRWLFISPSVSYSLSNTTSLSLSGQWPVYHDLNGSIQLTTRFSIGLSLNILLNNSKL